MCESKVGKGHCIQLSLNPCDKNSRSMQTNHRALLVYSLMLDRTNRTAFLGLNLEQYCMEVIFTAAGSVGVEVGFLEGCGCEIRLLNGSLSVSGTYRLKEVNKQKLAKLAKWKLAKAWKSRESRKFWPATLRTSIRKRKLRRKSETNICSNLQKQTWEDNLQRYICRNNLWANCKGKSAKKLEKEMCGDECENKT